MNRQQRRAASTKRRTAENRTDTLARQVAEIMQAANVPDEGRIAVMVSLLSALVRARSGSLTQRWEMLEMVTKALSEAVLAPEEQSDEPLAA
ncbi:hypothetical protein EOD42_14465 [Rhodovarius crocodyli]|uniref:Uncharacterized protein n=1 Tax=Rhodovarius crocodyli TaxID=1979269 RepID=A0A437MFA3_9PROT|nr:hypothetical protein [Rhodovarius crocodyli]RVT96310.1 hypothetical protein EOD42_14465 [Rhodovarius crocodyli]